MSKKFNIQIHLKQSWVNAAEVTDLGGGRCRFEYDTNYLYGDDSLPVSLAMPLRFYDIQYLAKDGGALETLDHRLPAFLYDLVPQGRGRQFLSGILGLPDSDGVELALLMAGAFNPIGSLRVDTAVAFYERESKKLAGGSYDLSHGVDFEEIQLKSEKFLQELSLHAMLASGTTGVQGAAPKYLLTKDKQGLWHPDMGLPDQQASEHWLLKLPRGRSQDDRLVLRNEAAYLRVAKACGLRTYADPVYVEDMLFVRRFDRVVVGNEVTRLHQESLASLAGHRGFAVRTTHNELLKAMREHVSDPLADTIEYLKREALNQAMRNTDNHARNTAIQRLANGVVALTPVFDFAPMYKDPEMVPRAVQWNDAAGNVVSDWIGIFNSLELEKSDLQRCANEMVDFSKEIANLAEICSDCGVDQSVVNECKFSMDRTATDLTSLRRFGGASARP
jgi:serine/threonine-protein kinase HipA